MMPPKFEVFDQADSDFSQVGRSMWWNILFQVLFSVVVSAFVSAVVASIMVNLNYVDSMETALGVQGIVMFVVGILAPLVTITLKKKKLKYHTKKEWLSFNFPLKSVFSIWFLTVGFDFAFSIVLSIINVFLMSLFGGSIEQPDFSMNYSLTYNIFLFLSIVIVAPIFEELFFRGFILQSLAKYHKGFAIFASAFLFGLMHLNIAQGISAFVYGLIIGYASLKYNSLLLPILVHGLNNLVSFITINFMDSEIFLMINAIYMVACFVYLIVFVTKHFKSRIQKEWKEDPMTYPYLSLFLKKPSIILLIIFFMLSSFMEMLIPVAI